MYHIRYNPKPIPVRHFDWDWWHEDYDGPGDPRAGMAESREAALEQIQELEEES